MTILSPETYPIIEGHEPALSNAIAGTCNEVYLGNANGCLIIVHEDFAVDANHLVLTIHEGQTAAEALAGTSVLGATQTFMGWFCVASQTSDAMVRQTDAATFTLDGVTAGNNSLYAFYIPSAILSDGYDWIQPDWAAGDGGNYASVLYILDGARYQQETPPSAI